MRSRNATKREPSDIVKLAGRTLSTPYEKETSDKLSNWLQWTIVNTEFHNPNSIQIRLPRFGIGKFRNFEQRLQVQRIHLASPAPPPPPPPAPPQPVAFRTDPLKLRLAVDIVQPSSLTVVRVSSKSAVCPAPKAIPSTPYIPKSLPPCSLCFRQLS
ncbi:hypothetical protein CYLTODRAFT_495420 [Cylindrobasidium torrendii FP15055 ss-10]|uniref:Uncharacterized protein n=1 Tax=Cylindrobasidium torrendii FP15055 ss-10 TaxID=1314674 RepID=A0A0D7ASR7_9AGAR|nr:hypothetical protein CYLTODRAFT_495420 [Cylindrobasidium torrendii FP15055 ss-10]